MRLRPVTYRYEQPFADGFKPIQYGWLPRKSPRSTRTWVLDSMLLNEVQRQQAEIGPQKEQIRLLQERLARLEAALESLSAGARVP